MTHQQQGGGPLGPYAISVIRTVVPLAWGYGVSWLISLGLPQSVLDNAHDVIVGGLTVAVTGGWYAGWRWLETKIPKLDSWTARVLAVLALGHPATPSYTTPAVVTEAPGWPTAEPEEATVSAGRAAPNDPPTVITTPVAPPTRTGAR